MGCLLALLARIGLLVVWVQTPLVKNGFQNGWILPLLGLLFLPITTLSYVVVYALGNGSVSGAAWLWVILGLLFDLGLHSSGYSSNRTRVIRYRTKSEEICSDFIISERTTLYLSCVVWHTWFRQAGKAQYSLPCQLAYQAPLWSPNRPSQRCRLNTTVQAASLFAHGQLSQLTA